jgi:SAM-dependent methyltransferase
LIRSWLAHPLTRNLDIDDPRTSELRRQIIQGKPFLRKIYEEWYSAIAAFLPLTEGTVVELGSGCGFMREVIPGLVTSDCFFCRGLDLVLDGQQLPFKDGSLCAIVMTDVFHHLPKPRKLFSESIRCLHPGGVIVMIEPWVTSWSKFIYKQFHSEPFEPDSLDWEFNSSGPLSSANGANPWIIFERDRETFCREFRELEIISIRPMMPFCYMVSGGVSLRSLMPGLTYAFWRRMEQAIHPWVNRMAMFAQIVLQRRESSLRLV